MKLFGIELSEKHIFFELDGKQYSVHFKDNLRKGVHDVSIWDERGITNAKVVGTYPPLKFLLKEIWRIYLPLWLRK